MTPRAIGIVRVSRDNGRGERRMSDAVQIAAMRRLADEQGWDLEIPEPYEINVSGNAQLPDRPQLSRAVMAVQTGAADVILGATVERLFWNEETTAQVKRLVQDAGGEVWAADQGRLTTAKAADRFTGSVRGAADRFSREQNAEKTIAAQIEALRRGAYIGPTPFGYTRIRTEGHPRIGGLLIDPATGQIVTTTFRVAATEGFNAAVAYLRQTWPQRGWKVDQVRRMLANRVYLGESHYSTLEPNLKAHDPLTTSAYFTAAQTTPRFRRASGDYVLSGVVTCLACGAGLTGQLQTAHHGRTYRRYRCSNPACNGGSSINADKLLAHVRGTLRTWLGSHKIRIHFEVEGLEEAERALQRARDEQQDLGSDLDFLRSLTPEARRANARALKAAIDEAQERYDLIAARAARTERLPAADELDDDAKLLAAIRGMVGAITVARGRGSINERVDVIPIVPFDLNDRTGVLSA